MGCHTRQIAEQMCAARPVQGPVVPVHREAVMHRDLGIVETARHTNVLDGS
jgi:hypothetical protein